MSLFKNIRKITLMSRAMEEQLYAMVMSEVEQGIKRDGLWGKALAKSGGDEDKAKALYIEYRVQSLKDETELANYIVSDANQVLSRNEYEGYAKQHYKNAQRAVEPLKQQKYYADKNKEGCWIVYGPDGSCMNLQSDEALVNYAIKICGDSWLA